MMQHTSEDTFLYASMTDLNCRQPMHSNSVRNNTWEKFQWHSRDGGQFSLKCFNGYYAAFIPGTMKLRCNGGWSEAAQLYYERAEIRGVWAAGVIQLPHHPVLGEMHRMYKIH